MRMKTGSQLKGRQNPAPGGVRSLNHPDVSKQKLRGSEAAPGGHGTKNQPNTTSGSGKSAKIGVGVADTYHANSRQPVDKKFDKHPHD